MAYIGDRWLNREERVERIELVSSALKKLQALIKADKHSEYHLDQFRNYRDELIKLKRVHRAEEDVKYFAYEYLSDGHNPGNADNVIMNDPDTGESHEPIENNPPIHEEFYRLCNYVSNEDRKARLAIAAARGHSKSGVFSNAFPLHQVVTRKRRYIQIISETDSLSKKLLGWINKQLKFNVKLREDFGALLDPKNQQNEKDNEEAFITTTNILVEAKSAGKQLRGSRHGAFRPDLIIIDDPSSINNEGTKEAREKLVHWFNSVVVPAGGKSASIVLVGTMVSATGLLNHVLKRKDFKSAFFSAILKEPDNPHLWEEYGELYSRSEEMDEVNAFYEAHKEELEAGIKVAWEWRWTYRALMHEKYNMGTRAFNSEYRNLAFSEDEQFFFPENYAKYFMHYADGYDIPLIKYDNRTIDIRKLTIVGAWDIAMGKSKRSDYNSVVIVGKDNATGHIYVLDEYSSKEKPHKFMQTVMQKIQQWRVSQFYVETINAYHEFYRQLQEKCRIEGLNFCTIKDVKSQKSNKEQRIESMQPILENLTLVLNDRHALLLDQLAQYPFADHDDAIDALQMAVDNISKPKARAISKPEWLY